ncbi:winged helix-turn-helix domain-containing protein [Mesorhizobium sp. A623]
MLDAPNNDRRLFNDAAVSRAIDEQYTVVEFASGRADRISSKSSACARDLMSFGPFRLSATERLLTRDGDQIDLGARALDILICLLSRPNEVFSKQELLDRVWPDVIVEEGSLRFQIARLRKTLGDGVDGARYIATLTGRGYCFVAAISPTRRSASTDDQSSIASEDDLGTRLTRMIECMTETAAVAAKPIGSCTVTIFQFSEDSKTAVIVAVANAMAGAKAEPQPTCPHFRPNRLSTGRNFPLTAVVEDRTKHVERSSTN